MDFTPKTNILRAFQNQNLSWTDVLSECIDNSLDAKANSIKVSFLGKSYQVEDDGVGCQDISTMIQLGSHVEHSDGGLGTYGIGLKDAWLFSGDKIEIETIHKSQLSKLSICVDDFQDTWQGPDPLISESDLESGTKILFHLNSKRRRPPRHGDLIHRLEWVFAPALEFGKQIVYRYSGRKTKILRPLRLPKFIMSVKESFEVEGKGVDFEIGILSPKESMENGPFWLSYGHRNIRSVSIGVGDYSTRGIGGRICLGNRWALTKNKNDVAELHDELEEAIFERIESLLKEAAELVDNIETDAIRSDIETALNEAWKEGKRQTKEARIKGDSIGTIIPKFTGKSRRKATKVHADKSGSVDIESQSGRKKGVFKVDFEEVDNDSIGRYDNTGNRIFYNMKHPFFSAIKNDTNVYLAVGISLISDSICRGQEPMGQMKLFQTEDFGETFGCIIKNAGLQTEPKTK